MYTFTSLDDKYIILFNGIPVLSVQSRSNAERIVSILDSDYKLSILKNIDILWS